MIKCFAATSSFWIDPQGRVRPCARFKSNIGHISSFASFSDINKNPFFDKLREEHRKGNWTTDCIRCKQDEANKLKSKRVFYEDLDLQANNDFMVDISMGNFCNLKCRMCGPHNSTQWNSDYELLLENKLVPRFKTSLDGYQLNDSDIDKLCDHLSLVNGTIVIELKGGEPLIMPRTRILAQRISELPNAKKIKLLIVTNGTLVPEWLADTATKIDKLQLIVSVDGVDEVYDYIRGNEKFKFDQCLNNIKIFNSLENIELKFNVVLQNLNIHQVFEIHALLIGFVGPKINYITLSGPGYLAINVMPKAARQKIYQEFEKNRKMFGEYETQLASIFDLLKQEPPDGFFDNFLKVSALLDKGRNQSLDVVFPHLLKPQVTS